MVILDQVLPCSVSASLLLCMFVWLVRLGLVVSCVAVSLVCTETVPLGWELASPQIQCGLQPWMCFHHHYVWFGTVFLGGSKYVIKFFSACHTNVIMIMLLSAPNPIIA